MLFRSAFKRDIGFIHQADALGYDEFMIGEHHSGGWETMPAPEMALAMAAANAPRIRLGTSVLSAPFHHPFHVAERMCFLDHLTRGRAILGVGPCSLPTDKQLFNMDDKRLYSMLHEAIDVIVRLLESAEPISHRVGQRNSAGVTVTQSSMAVDQANTEGSNSPGKLNS